MRCAALAILPLLVAAGCGARHEAVSDEQLNAINRQMSAREMAAAQEDAERRFVRPPAGFPARSLPSDLSQESAIEAIETCFEPNRVARLGDVYGNDRHVIVFFFWTGPNSSKEAPARISFNRSRGAWTASHDIHVVQGGREKHHLCPSR